MTFTHGGNHTGKTRTATGWLIAGIVLALLLAGAGVTAYYMVVKAPADLARRTAEGIREVFDFTPRVTLNETVLIAENTPILEVATVSRSLLIRHRWSHTWLGSTKTLELHGSFTAKAGFDLREPFAIDIRRSPLRVVARMPAPKLLSVQMTSELLRYRAPPLPSHVPSPEDSRTVKRWKVGAAWTQAIAPPLAPATVRRIRMSSA